MLHQPALELSHPSGVWSPYAARQAEQTLQQRIYQGHSERASRAPRDRRRPAYMTGWRLSASGQAPFLSVRSLISNAFEVQFGV